MTRTLLTDVSQLAGKTIERAVWAYDERCLSRFMK